MDHTLHLLVVDAERTAALVSWIGGRWLLPILRQPERVRAGPALVRWMSERGLGGSLVGQWHARLSPARDSIDSLVVIDASVQPRLDVTNLAWTSLASLTASASVLDYQQSAVAATLSSSVLPSVSGPFGTLAAVRAAETWIADTLAEIGLGMCDRLVPLRATAYERVLEVSGACGRLYFKGLSAERTGEAIATSMLSALAPDSFPRTLALAMRDDGSAWWLMTACPGVALAARPSLDHAIRAADACAEIQRRVTEVIADDRWSALPVVDVPAVAAWAAGFLPDSRVVDEACTLVSRADVPRSWVWTDFDPANVIVDGDHIGFIDLDESVIGPAPLAVSTFARRMRRVGTPCDNAVYRAYERAWHRASSQRIDWPAFDVVSRLVECYADWRRVVLRAARGEIADAPGDQLNYAREQTAARLARAAQTRQLT